MAKSLPPLHPGEILREEFLVPLNLSPARWRKRWACRALGTSAQLWLNLQNRYDVETAERVTGDAAA